MTPSLKHAIAALVLLGGSSLVGAGSAAQETKINTNAVGAGSAWQGSLTSASSIDGSTFDDEQLSVIESVNNYFNKIKHLRGRFAQIDAQNRTLKGQFFVQWPGRFRFDYARPSRLVIFSDGSYLRIVDRELKNSETYALSSTPFRIILAKNVDIQRDARILQIGKSDTEVLVALRDKKEDTGAIQLRFMRSADDSLSLKSWTITDAQGLDTRIEVSSLVTGKPASPKLFKPSKMVFPNQNGERN